MSSEMIELNITDLSDKGEGSGHMDGYTFFVRDAIPGDRIRAKVTLRRKKYGFAIIQEILSPSADRTKPQCPAFPSCGGCRLQAMRYEAQLRWKTGHVAETLKRIGGYEGEVRPIIGMESPWHYRNKSQFPVGMDPDGEPVAGYYAYGSHDIIAADRCLISTDAATQIRDIVLCFLREYDIPPYLERDGSGLVRHILIREGFATGEIMLCLVINGTELPHADRLIGMLRPVSGLTSIWLNYNTRRDNVILGRNGRVLWGKERIRDRIGSREYEISPMSFYQVNPIQTKVLYDNVKEFAALSGKEVVWDLYCGIGTIGLYLADQAKEVCGIEVIEQAIHDARHNAERNGFSNTQFFCGKAEEAATSEALPKPDLIIVDPPRKGCAPSLITFLNATAAPKLIYVSCDPATLARDLQQLCELGPYQVDRVQPVDCFPHTMHVETVVLMSRKDT